MLNWGKRLMNKNNIRVIAFVLLLTCSLLITGCSSTEINTKEEASIKEDVTYKITWSEKGEDHTLEFSPYDHVLYRASAGNKTIFYFDDNSEFESIIVQSGLCTIVNRDKSLMIISGDFVIEPIEGE